ncbi:unnamed protein product, partial [marine sediment metagenome]
EINANSGAMVREIREKIYKLTRTIGILSVSISYYERKYDTTEFL